MKAIGLKSVASLMTSLCKRSDLRAKLLTKGSRAVLKEAVYKKSKPLSKEAILGLIEICKLASEEVDLYNLHALPEERVDKAVLKGTDREVVEFPEMLNGYGLSSLIKEAIEKKYVVNDKKLWSNFLYQWSSKSKKKLNEPRWLSISTPASRCF